MIDFYHHVLAGDSAVSLWHDKEDQATFATPFVSCSSFAPQKNLPPMLVHVMDRFAQMAMVSTFAAWEDAALARNPGEEDRRNWGVLWGSSLGGIQSFENGYRQIWHEGRRRVSPLSVVQGMHNAANAHISIQLGLGGISSTYAAACASSSIAIGEAFHRIRRGEATVMVTGGSDATGARAVVRAWEAMKVMAPGDEVSAKKACRPFSAQRADLVLGEGSATLVLEEWEHAVRRNAKIRAEMVGYGVSSDHHHLMAPHVDGQVRALTAALHDASMAPQEVDYVNARGTGTREVDPVEIASLKAVFGAYSKNLPVSSTKSVHGHLLGALDAMDALITILALKEQTIPPTAILEDVADDCEGVDHVRSGRSQKVRAALSNSFAFGGSNAVLIFRSVS